MKCPVNFCKRGGIHHENFLSKWLVIFFDEKECDGVTKRIT